VKSYFSTVSVNSYAKVNLSLDILERRPDGFHDIESVMQSIDLHDMITMRIATEPGITVMCDSPGIPTGEANLAYKAASVLCQRYRIADGVQIRIRKQVPVQAGLGGGSSNASAVLLGLNSLLGLSIGQGELRDMAACIGSDVPFFIYGGTALARGRGEDILELPDIPVWWMVIVKPEFGVSTAWAYRRLDEMRLAADNIGSPNIGIAETASQRMLRCLESGNAAQLPTALANDMEPPAVEQHPEIEIIKARLVDAGAAGALMSGSGSAVFGLFAHYDEASRAVDYLSGLYRQVFLSKTIGRSESIRVYSISCAEGI
jgi:4-diphosphocytidyl-2-C-methyl-D-erythritol kinase